MYHMVKCDSLRFHNKLGTRGETGLGSLFLVLQGLAESGFSACRFKVLGVMVTGAVKLRGVRMFVSQAF